MSKKHINKNYVNDEEIIKIQNDIDNLEKKLFSEDNLISIDESNSILNTNNNNIINESIDKQKNNNNTLNENEPFIDYNNNLEKSENISYVMNKNEECLNKNKSKKEEINIENNDNKEKIRKLIELQREIDELREKRGKKINYKSQQLNKAYYNNKKIKKKNNYK